MLGHLILALGVHWAKAENAFRELALVSTGPNDCVVNTETYTVISSTAVKCSSQCLASSGCSKFLYCPSSKNCRLGGVSSSSSTSGCHCFIQAGKKNTCGNGGTWNDGVCSCVKGYYGDNCQNIIKDCTEGKYLELGSGDEVAYILPRDAARPFQVLCDFRSGSTYLSSRNPVSCQTKEDFNRDWSSYVNGFGNLTCEHWLGLENIHLLTSQGHYKLEMSVVYDAVRVRCFFNPFSVDGLDRDYLAHIPLTDPDAFCNEFLHGDMAFDINDKPFSTSDKDFYGLGCPGELEGGWWLGENNCGNSNMNGPFVDLTKFPINPLLKRLDVGGPLSHVWTKRLALRVERT